MFILAGSTLSASAQEDDLNGQLMNAVLKGDAEAAKTHIDAGADVNAKKGFGGTALMRAADKGHIETVRVLIAAGAGKDRESLETAFVLAAFQGNAEMVKALIVKDGSISYDGIDLETAYMIALNKRYTEIVNVIKDLKNFIKIEYEKTL